MSFIVGFGRFWYDFIIGDDWTIAAAVVVALLVTNLLVRAHVTAWWLVPARGDRLPQRQPVARRPRLMGLMGLSCR